MSTNYVGHDGYANTVGVDEAPFKDFIARVAGDWVGNARIHGGDGNFGIICANYGGSRHAEWKEAHILADIFTSPGHVFCFQEADALFCKALAEPCPTNLLEKVRCQTENKRKPVPNSPQGQIVVARSPEKGQTSIAVAVRDSHFKALRRDAFMLLDAGRNRGKEARNRLMFCTAKFRAKYFLDSDPDPDEFGIAVAHLHCGCAKKTNNMGGTHYNTFFDELGHGIVRYKSRVLCMDANMALWCVVPELRARGFMVSMAAFFPFKVGGKAMVDSLGIFVIGPTERIKMAYCPSVLGKIKEPERSEGDALVQHYRVGRNCIAFGGETCELANMGIIQSLLRVMP